MHFLMAFDLQPEVFRIEEDPLVTLRPSNVVLLDEQSFWCFEISVFFKPAFYKVDFATRLDSIRQYLTFSNF